MAQPQAVWLVLGLLVTLVHGLLGLREAFSSPYVIQSDARQYVTWMPRFRDPDLFPHDLIADYFDAISPLGFRAFYWLFDAVGVDPIVLSKLLPIVLGLITTAYAFALCLRLLPSLPGAFASVVVLNQSLWMTDDLVSATPRAFGYPLLIVFLYYAARRSLPGTVIAISLEGLFYPQVAAISAGTLVLLLVRWQGGRPRLSNDRRDYVLSASGIVAALVVLLPSVVYASAYGPAIGRVEARNLPAFLPGGRAQFFFDDPWEFWVTRERSGFMPQQFGPSLVWVSLLLPIVLVRRAYFPLAERIATGIRPLPQFVVASFVLFFAAHAALFRLYLPGRYTQPSLRVAMALAAGMVLAVVLERGTALLREWTRLGGTWSPRLMAGGVAFLLGALLLAPSIPWMLRRELPDARYRQGEASGIYDFFAEQPKSTVVASVSDVADFIPPFARRSVLVSPKYALPYQVGYYHQIETRARDLIRAQYSPDLKELQDVSRQYGVDFWLVRRSAFSTQYVRNSWMMDFEPEASDAIKRLRQGAVPAMAGLLSSCAAYSTGGLVVVQTACIVNTEPVAPGRRADSR